MPIVGEETFAPILYVMTLRDARRGDRDPERRGAGADLGASSPNDLREAEQFLSAEGSDCGIANVNIGTSGAEIGGAFGGEKATGGGREAGSDAWKAYMRRQTCTINRGAALPLAQGIRFELAGPLTARLGDHGPARRIGGTGAPRGPRRSVINQVEGALAPLLIDQPGSGWSEVTMGHRLGVIAVHGLDSYSLADRFPCGARRSGSPPPTSGPGLRFDRGEPIAAALGPEDVPAARQAQGVGPGRPREPDHHWRVSLYPPTGRPLHLAFHHEVYRPSTPPPGPNAKLPAAELLNRLDAALPEAFRTPEDVLAKREASPGRRGWRP